MYVDCHRHFGGSISVKFVWDLVQQHGMRWLAESITDVQNAMQFAPNEERDFIRFLNKFNILNDVEWTVDLLEASIKQVCDDLLAEDIEFCWMHFTINKYVDNLKWHRKDIIKFMCECFNRYAPGRIGPVLCLKYESPKASQRQIAKLIEEKEVYDNVCGIDLVGDERYYDATFYSQILRPWKNSNKLLFAHVGESCTAANVITAIEHVGVTEVCHGLRLFELPNVLQIVRNNDVCFHMALTSNILTGVTTNDHHPIAMFIENKLPVTIGTDDPTQCSTTMEREYSLLRELLSLDYQENDVTKYAAIVADNAINRVRNKRSQTALRG